LLQKVFIISKKRRKMEMIGRFFRPPPGSYFLFGPRGTGKSVWTQHAYPAALRLDFLEPEVFRAYSSYPERLRQLVEAQPQRRTVIIDEVQKLPEVLPLVHALIERDKQFQFVLTGSSARKLKRSGVDLLAGRAVLRHLPPYMAAELGTRFALSEALSVGMLPLVLGAPDPRDTLRSYAALYVREEVQMEGLVRNVGNFSRFLEVLAFSHGSVLNMANIARECEIGQKAVEGFLSIVEDLLLAFRVPIFTRRAQRATAKHPKFYYCDTGVFRSLRPHGPLDRAEEIEGAALEGLVAQQLRAWIAYTEEPHELFFWRTRSGVEVDFIVYGSSEFVAIEVKNAARIHPRDLAPLKIFRQDYPSSRQLLLYRGNERRTIDGIVCMPCEEFLRTLQPAYIPA
jgi:predicted AAA+ superfamily ATPase